MTGKRRLWMHTVGMSRTNRRHERDAQLRRLRLSRLHPQPCERRDPALLRR